MFVYDFVQIVQPYPAVRDRLLDAGSSWVGRAATEAYGEGVELRARVGPRDGRPLGSKAVRIHLGTPYARGDGVLLPMSWVATGVPGIFPAMEADLGVAPLGAAATQITLSGMYTPPLGRAGEMADAVILHRLGEATIRSFLTRIAEAVLLQTAQSG